MSDTPVATGRDAPLRCFERRCEVGAADTLGGHVNFDAYFRHLAAALQAWYAAMGIERRDAVLGGMVMAHVELDYRGETWPPATLLCRLTVERVGRSSLAHRVELFDAADLEAPRVTGRTVHVWRDPAGATAPWPASVLARCWGA